MAPVTFCASILINVRVAINRPWYRVVRRFERLRDFIAPDAIIINGCPHIQLEQLQVYFYDSRKYITDGGLSIKSLYGRRVEWNLARYSLCMLSLDR